MRKDEKEQVQQAIREHLNTVGSQQWEAVFKRFPDVPVATMWRWIAACKKGMPGLAEVVTAKAKITQKIRSTKRRTARHEEAIEAGEEQFYRQLPAAPSPAAIARSGEQAMQAIDFAAEVHALYADTMMLRAHSVRLEEDGTERIKNPVLFERQIARRTALIDTTIKTLQELWDLRTMQGFYETIIDEIGKESPDAQRRILERLRVLNANTGMTIFMKV